MRTIKSASFISATIAFAIGLAILAGTNKIDAQQTPSDRFNITLSHPVTLGNQVLLPGNYRVEPLTIAGGDAPVLLIRGDKGISFKTSVMVAPALENRIQPETRVLLRHIGHRYYFDKIWVEGVAYGYRFPPPKSVKERASESR